LNRISLIDRQSDVKSSGFLSPSKSSSDRSQGGFSRTELCAVLGAVAILSLTLGISLAGSREPGSRAACANNLRQLGMAALIYSAENGGQFPPRFAPYWMTRLHPYYLDLRLLKCPTDPKAEHTAPPGLPDDATNPQYAPRSYLINGWNDYFQATLVDTNGVNDQRWEEFKNHQYPFGMSETAIPEPSETIAFGEKVSDSAHMHMDFFQGYGDDVTQIEHSRHFPTSPSGSSGGGSNYSMADGSVRFLNRGHDLAPTNLWAVVEAWRTNTVTAQ
jgi:prepilin-type processing-associated H-X9-DG protein